MSDIDILFKYLGQELQILSFSNFDSFNFEAWMEEIVVELGNLGIEAIVVEFTVTKT